MGMRLQGSRNNTEPGSVLVQTMHNARPRNIHQRRVLMQQAVHQGAVAMTRRWMHDEPRRFIHYMYRLIAMHQLDGHGFCRDGRRAIVPALLPGLRHSIRWQLQRNLLAADQPVAAAPLLPVHRQVPGCNPGLQPAARIVIE